MDPVVPGGAGRLHSCCVQLDPLDPPGVDAREFGSPVPAAGTGEAVKDVGLDGGGLQHGAHGPNVYGGPWFAPPSRTARGRVFARPSLKLISPTTARGDTHLGWPVRNSEETAMGNDWTRLLQETKEHGGPDGLRANYIGAGVLLTIGAIQAWKLVRVGGSVVGDYLAERKAAAEAAKRAQAKREEADRRASQAKPAAAPPRDVQHPPELHLVKLVDRVRGSLVDELGERTQVTVYEGRNSLEAIVEAYDPKRKTSMLRHYEVFYASQSIAVRTSSGVVWDEHEEGSSLLGVRREGTVPDLGEELDAVIEKTRTRRDGNPLSGETKVFHSPGGLHVLIDDYDTGAETSTLRCYGLNAGTSNLWARVARDVSWQESDSVAFSDI